MQITLAITTTNRSVGAIEATVLRIAESLDRRASASLRSVEGQILIVSVGLPYYKGTFAEAQKAFNAQAIRNTTNVMGGIMDAELAREKVSLVMDGIVHSGYIVRAGMIGAARYVLSQQRDNQIGIELANITSMQGQLSGRRFI